MRRLRLLVPLVLLLSLAGCDSGGSSASPLAVDGEYRITRLELDSENTTYGVIDVLPYLVQSGLPPTPEITLDLFGQQRTYTFAFRLAGDAARTGVQGSFSTTASAVRLDFGAAHASSVRRLLLPASISLTASGTNGSVLSTSIRHTVSFAELAALDPDRFRNISGTLSGQLRVTAERQ